MGTDTTWQEDLKRARWLRFASAAGIAAIGLVLAAEATHITRSLGDDGVAVESAAYPSGSEGSTTTYEPFTLAGASNRSASTTIPWDLGSGSATASSTAPTIPVPTTRPPGVPLPDPHGDKICEGAVTIGQLMSGQVFKEGATEIPEGIPAALLQGADILEQANEPKLDPLIAASLHAASEVAGATTIDQVRDAFKVFTAPSDPKIAAALLAVYQHSQEFCPGLTGAM